MFFLKRYSLHTFLSSLTFFYLPIPSTIFITVAVNGTKMPSKNFVFKCHRDGSNVHSVNSIDFHHYGSFCTAGSDGTFSWWDKEARYVRTCISTGDYIILFIILYDINKIKLKFDDIFFFIFPLKFIDKLLINVISAP